jgi:cation:H+ antiporter
VFALSARPADKFLVNPLCDSIAAHAFAPGLASSVPMLLSLFFVLAGIGLLYLGGEWMVDGATDLARRLGWHPMTIGLTVIAFGTSAPELAATLAATFEGAPAMAFGNVVGSNIANLGLILGAVGLIAVMTARRRFLQREVPVVLGASVLMAVTCWDGLVTRSEGFFLLAGMPLYLLLLFFSSAEPGVELDGGEDEPPHLGRALLYTLAGIALLMGGAESLVHGASDIARALGVSDRVIGITLVALGTSLPELAAAVSAALRRQTDLVLGNVVGSNVFNILLILGATAALRPIRFDAAEAPQDLVSMLVITATACAVLALRRAGRWGAGLLLALYAVYVLVLVV